MIDTQVLPADRIGLIAEIDHSEHVDTVFKVHAGELRSRLPKPIERDASHAFQRIDTGLELAEHLVDAPQGVSIDDAIGDLADLFEQGLLVAS